MDGNQRFQYPAIARYGPFDSVLIGTSTSGILNPKVLSEILGGRFANLAMDSARAWEQWQIAGLFHDNRSRPDTLLVGLDHVWCDADADQNRVTFRGFPDFLFDNNPWNDWLYVLNSKGLEISGRRLLHALGKAAPKISPDGYKVFLPDEALYDIEKVRKNIGPARSTTKSIAPFIPTEQQRSAWKFPALAWLEIMVSGNWRRVIMFFTPVHVSAMPAPGTEALAREQECKRQVTELAHRQGWPLIDFRISSEITSHEENYWDPLHYRVPVGHRIIDGIKKALSIQQDDPAGDWHMLAAARAQVSGQ